MLEDPRWHSITKATNPKKRIECLALDGFLNCTYQKARSHVLCLEPQGAGDECKSKEIPENLQLD
jgi:hypothetical protein